MKSARASSGPQRAHAAGAVFRVLPILFACCTVTPVPDPPNLDPDLVTVNVEGSVPYVVGDVGSADPLAEAWGVDLEGGSAAVTAAIGADGSFRLGPLGRPGGEIRLQVRTASARSEPIDASVAPGILAPVTRPLDDCLTIAPPREAALAATTVIAIANGCSGELVVDAIRLRAPVPAITIETAAPLRVAAGASAEIRVALTPGPTPIEEILFLDVSAPEPERLPITLFRLGGP